jgi:hypothetical protein
MKLPRLVLGGVGAILAVAGIWLGASRLRRDFRVRTTSGSADVIAAVPPSRVPTP